MSRPEKHDLIDDVLAEASPQEFRATLLQQTLHTVRRRRRLRQCKRIAGVVATFVMCGMLLWPRSPERVAVARPIVKKALAAPYKIVATVPLSESAIVQTRPVDAKCLIASTSTVLWIGTVPGWFRPINDDELLALVGPRPAALVRVGPGVERLIFPDASNQPN